MGYPSFFSGALLTFARGMVCYQLCFLVVMAQITPKILFLLFYIIFNFFYCFHWNGSSHIISEPTSVFGLDFSLSFLCCPIFPILRR